MRKVLKACVISVCVLAIVLAIVLAYSTADRFNAIPKKFNISYQIINRAETWRYCVSDKDFNAHYDDFLAVAQVAEKYNDEAEKTGNRCIMVDYDQQSMNNHLDYLTNGYKSVRVDLSGQEQKSLNSITKAFKCKDAKLDMLRIFKNRISFETDNGQYTLVYSINDSKPTFLNLPEKKENYYVRKIKKCWYNVVANPG